MSFMFANAGAARNWSAKQAKPAAGVGSKAPQPLKEAKDNPIVIPPAQAGPTKRPPSPKQSARPAAAVAVPTTPVVAAVSIEVSDPGFFEMGDEGEEGQLGEEGEEGEEGAPAAPAGSIPPARPAVPPAPAAPTLRAKSPAPTTPAAALSTAPHAFPAPPPSVPRTPQHALAVTAGLPASDGDRVAHMRREVQRFSEAMEQQLLGTRKLVLRIGGAQKLPPPKPVDGGAPAKLKPYVVVRAVDRTGRKVERPGLERESGLPKQHLTLTESAPAWDEELELELDGEAAAQLGAITFELLDTGPRSKVWFGATKEADTRHAHGSISWAELSASNLETREHTVALADSQPAGGGAAAAPSGATLTVRSFLVDMARYQQDVLVVERAIAQAAGDKAAAAAARQRSELRLRRETEILEGEMEQDFRQQATVQAARMLKDLRAELVEFVQSEETLCDDEESRLGDETSGAVALLEAASDTSLTFLALERAVYADEAPLVHRQLHPAVEAEQRERLALAQRANLRLVKSYSDAKVQMAEQVAARLHQATDYQRVLHREVVGRVRKAALPWGGAQRTLLREETAHGATRFATAQQAVQAESLAAAAVLHAALVQLESAQEEQASAMRLHQQSSVDVLAASGEQSMADLAVLEAEVADQYKGDEAAMLAQAEAKLRALDERGATAVAGLHAAIQRVDVFDQEVEAEVEAERVALEQLSELEAESRLELATAGYERRLSRLSGWVAATEEEARRVEGETEEERRRTALELQRRREDLDAMQQAERAGRDELGEARAEHVARLHATHAELTRELSAQQAGLEQQMGGLLREREVLGGALTRTHIATVQANAAEALQAASKLREGLRSSQAEMAVALLVMQTEVQDQAAGAREEQLRRVFGDTSHTITLGNVHGAMAVQLRMQRAEHADELACLRHGMVAAERSWAAERTELLAAFERVAASRRGAADARKEQALNQLREHYALLVRQRQAWVDEAREKAARRAKAEEAEAAEAEAAEAEGAAREAEAFRRLDHTAQAISSRDSAWLDDRHRATAVEARAREARERQVAADLVQQSVMQLAAQREAGTRENARAHTGQLVQLEEEAHDAALRRAARANEDLLRIGESHAAAVARDAVQRARLGAEAAAREARLEEERVTSVIALLNAARGRGDGVRTRTCAGVRLLASEAVKSLLRAEEGTHLQAETAAARHTVLLERHQRQRQQHVLKALEALRAREGKALAALRASTIEVARGEQAAHQAAEAALLEQLQQALPASEPERSAWREADAAGSAGYAQARLDSGAAFAAELERSALGWQDWAHERFGVMAVTWGRQQFHQAQLAHRTQQARQTAFEEQWGLRQAERQERANEQWVEHEKDAGELVGTYRGLQTEAVLTCQRMQEAAQLVLTQQAEEMVGTTRQELQAQYGEAHAVAEQAAAGVRSALASSAGKSAALLEEVNEGRSKLGPEPLDYVRETLRWALQGDEQAAAAASMAEHEEGARAAQAAAGARAVEGLARAREQQLVEEREAARERRRAAAAAEREREEVAALAQAKAEEERLMRDGRAELERAAKEQAELCDLAWEAREAGLSSAAAARLSAAQVAHAQLVDGEVRLRRRLEERRAAAAAAGGGGRVADVDAALALAEAQLAARSGPARAASEAQRSFDASLEVQRRNHDEQLRVAAAEACARNEAAMSIEVPQLAAAMRVQLGELSVAQRSAVLAALIAAAPELSSEQQLRQQEAIVELLEQHRQDEQAAREQAAATNAPDAAAAPDAPDAPDAPAAPDAKDVKAQAAQAAQAAQLKGLHDKLRSALDAAAARVKEAAAAEAAEAAQAAEAEEAAAERERVAAEEQAQAEGLEAEEAQAENLAAAAS